MRKFTIKSLLIAAALCLGTSAWAQISSLPASYDFETGTTPFVGGESYGTANTTNALVVYKSKGAAEALFDIDTEKDGSQPYSIQDNEEITFYFKAFHGWLSNGKAEKVSVKNSKGIELVSYSYTSSNCNVTDVSIGNKTVSGFSAFFCQSRYNASKSSNGFSNNAYTSNDADHTFVKFVITGRRTVEIYITQETKGILKTFSGSLDEDVLLDLYSMNITANNDNQDRAIAIDNLQISKEITTTNYANYTICYICGSDTIKTETVEGEVGQYASLTDSQKASFFKDNMKYIYLSDDAANNPISDDDSTVITVKLREAETFTYTINAIDENEKQLLVLSNGSNFEGETSTVYYSKYINVDGIWYETAQKSEPYYGYSFTETSSQDVQYVKSDVTLFVEGENLSLSSGSYSGGAYPSRYSNGAARRLHKNSYAYTPVPAGEYTLSLYGRNQSGTTAGTLYVYIKDSNGNLSDTGLNMSWNSGNTSIQTVDGIVVPANCSLVINNNSEYNSNIEMDYLSLTKTGELVSISENGIATYTPSVALDFTNATSIKAYTATVSETTVTLTETKTVAAGEGVIIQSVNGGEATEAIAVANPATATEGNALVGTLVDIAALATTDGTYNNYILNFVDGKAGFYQANNKKVAAGKAYLQVPVANGAKVLTIVWNDGETTGINSVETVEIENGNVYDLSGRKVANPAKGLYIKNGKKFIVK